MKVSDIKYQRYTIEDFRTKALPLVAALNEASSAQHFIEIKNQLRQEVKAFLTMTSLAYIRFTLDTRDKFYSDEYQYYSQVLPEISDIDLAFSKALLSSPHRAELESIMPKTAFLGAELSIIANNPLLVEDRKAEGVLSIEYENLTSQLMFDFDGKSMPLTLLCGYFEDEDREVRRQAHEALGRGLNTVSDKLDGIYNQLVHTRDNMAKKLGYPSFIELGYCFLNRYDYTPKMIEDFRNNIKKHIVPKIIELKKQTQQEFGIDKFMFFDNSISVKGGEPRPMLNKDGIFFEAKQMYNEMNPELGAFMQKMLDNDAIDVDSREGKIGGGYATTLDSFAQPFIFANFNGTAADIGVMTHEFGHAFAMEQVFRFASYDVGIGNAETAECHSMGMEMLCHKYMDKFFGIDAKKYRYKHIYEGFEFFAFGSVLDEFQHIVYQNPSMTPQERNRIYLDLEKKYRPYLSYEGITYLEQGTRWQYKAHPYVCPFYYIDYCLAQTVAFGFLIKSMQNYDEALRLYMEFTRKGGTERFVDLCKQAGIGSPFEEETIKQIAQEIPQILQSLKN